MPQVEVIGVYPVKAPEPCHLIELVVADAKSDFDVGKITQAVDGRPRDNWQVPWDEHFLNEKGEALFNSSAPSEVPASSTFRLVFFLHYLNINKPLITPYGPVPLPKPSNKPSRLSFVVYEPPC